MADVEINVTGEMENGYSDTKQYPDNTFQLPRIPIPLGQFGYPKAQEWLHIRTANIRPWALFLNTNNFRLPPSATRLTKRVMKNIEYFQSNYFFVFVGLVLYCLITSPLLLIVVAGALGACYKVSQKNARQELVLFNQKITLAQTYAAIAVCSLPLFYLVGAGAILFWVLGVSWFLISIHAAFYNIDSVLCPGEDELNLVMEEV